MSIIKTLEKLGQDPSESPSTLTEQQRAEIHSLTAHAQFINANLIIDDPTDPDEEPEPNKAPNKQPV